MPFPPRNTISEQKTFIEMNINTMGATGQMELPSCSPPPLQIEIK
jgi:hypothetical protein